MDRFQSVFEWSLISGKQITKCYFFWIFNLLFIKKLFQRRLTSRSEVRSIIQFFILIYSSSNFWCWLIVTYKIFFHLISDAFLIIFLGYFLFFILVWSLIQILELFFVENSFLVISILSSSLHLNYLIIGHFRIHQYFIRGDVTRLLSEYFLLIFFVATSQFLHYCGIPKIRYELCNFNKYDKLCLML